MTDRRNDHLQFLEVREWLCEGFHFFVQDHELFHSDVFDSQDFHSIPAGVSRED